MKRILLFLLLLSIFVIRNYAPQWYQPATNYKEIINIPRLSGKGNIHVAVIDQGFDENNPAISDNIFRADYNEKSPADHGLGVVGIIQAVAPDVQIHYLENFYGYDALTNVLHSGCKVLNISWGNPGVFVKEAIQKIVDQGIIIVKSAGNEGVRIGGSNDTLSWSELAAMPEMRGQILIVGSVEERKGRLVVSSFSNYSKKIIYAPGKNIKVLSKHGKVLASGTSYCAPQVSGALALLIEKFPRQDPQWYVELIKNSCTDHNGVKVINIKEALRRGTTILN